MNRPLGIIIAILAFINGMGVLQAVAGAPLSVIIFIYLLLPDARRAFGSGNV